MEEARMEREWDEGKGRGERGLEGGGEGRRKGKKRTMMKNR